MESSRLILSQCKFLFSCVLFLIAYIYAHTHTHTHTHIYIYIYLLLTKNKLQTHLGTEMTHQHTSRNGSGGGGIGRDEDKEGRRVEACWLRPRGWVCMLVGGVVLIYVCVVVCMHRTTAHSRRGTLTDFFFLTELSHL